MAFLYWLESIRAPFLDQLMALVTHLGEEALFLAIGLAIFWCVDKRKGYYLLSVGLTGTVLNQWLKIGCRVPRPWVRDPNFTIVESARAAATGYSFPSGHTQSVVSYMGCIARWTEKTWVRVTAIVLALLTAFSRMYLGVHTPWDVGVGLVSAAILVFIMHPVLHWADDQRKMNLLFGGMTALAALFAAYAQLWHFPADVDPVNLMEAQKNAYTLLGAISGVWIAYNVDQRWIHFPTKAPLWGQAVKLLGGVVLVLAVKSLLKAPLLSLMGGSLAAHGVRYFLVVIVAGCFWPMTFTFFARYVDRK